MLCSSLSVMTTNKQYETWSSARIQNKIQARDNAHQEFHVGLKSFDCAVCVGHFHLHLFKVMKDLSKSSSALIKRLWRFGLGWLPFGSTSCNLRLVSALRMWYLRHWCVGNGSSRLGSPYRVVQGTSRDRARSSRRCGRLIACGQGYLYLMRNILLELHLLWYCFDRDVLLSTLTSVLLQLICLLLWSVALSRICNNSRPGMCLMCHIWLELLQLNIIRLQR